MKVENLKNEKMKDMRFENFCKWAFALGLRALTFTLFVTTLFALYLIVVEGLYWHAFSFIVSLVGFVGLYGQILNEDEENEK